MIYLASSSPRRRTLLKKASLRFKIIRPLYQEVHRETGSASALTRRHALGKALSVVANVQDGIVLGSDTVVVCGGHILGKPRSMKAAERMLLSLEGRWHSVVSAVALLKIREGVVQKKKVFTENTRVYIRKSDIHVRRAYLKRIRPLDKAGAYAAQAAGKGAVQKIQGSFTNVVGLPMEKLQTALRMLR